MINRVTLHSLKGREFRYHGIPAVVKVIDEETQTLIIYRGKDIFDRKYCDFLKEIQDQSVIFTRQLAKPLDKSGLSAKQIEKISILEAYLFEMLKYKNPTVHVQLIIDIVSARIGDKNPPACSTLCKKFKSWKEHGYDASVLFILKKSVFPVRILPEIESLMEEFIRSKYLTSECKSASDTHYDFFKECKYRGYPIVAIPSVRTFQRRIKKLDRYEVVAARQGLSEAKKQFRKVCHKYNIEVPLDRVECDSAHFNLGLIEYKNDEKFYIGTVSLDLAFDCATGSLLGYCVHIAQKGEKCQYIISMLSHAVNPKPNPNYIQFGIPRHVIVDGGVGYRAELTRAYLTALGCEFETTPTRTPWAKPFVERFVLHLRQKFFSNTKGYLGKFDPNKYTDLPLKKAAFLTIEQFQQKLANFVIEYHKTPLKSNDNLSPNDAWKKGTELYPPFTVEDKAELAKYKPIKISDHCINDNKGITYQYQWFNSHELMQLRESILNDSHTADFKVDILVDPNDATSISVVLPSSYRNNSNEIELLEVPNTNRLSFGKSFAQINVKNGKKLEKNGAHVFVNYENQSRYRKAPKVGDKIDILSDETLSTVERKEQLEAMFQGNPEYFEPDEIAIAEDDIIDDEMGELYDY